MKWKTIPYLFLLPFYLIGCVKEDTEYCPPVNDLVHLSFVYSGDGFTDIFPRHIQTVSLYVFSATGLFFGRYDIPENRLSQRQGYDLELPSGSYQLVLWGNAADHTMINERSHKYDFALSHPELKAGSAVLQTYDSLYYARGDILKLQQQSLNVVIPFVSAHIRVEIHLSGLHFLSDESSIDPADFILELTDLAARYNFDRMTVGQPVSIHPQLVMDTAKETFSAVCNTLRFPDDNDVRVNFYRKRENVLSLGLADFMRRFNLTVEDRQDAKISIFIRFLANGGIEIGTEPWDTTPIKPDL